MANGMDAYARVQFAKDLDETIVALNKDANGSEEELHPAGVCASHAGLIMRSRRQAKATAMILSILRETQDVPRKPSVSRIHVAGISTVISGVILGVLEAVRIWFPKS